MKGSLETWRLRAAYLASVAITIPIGLGSRHLPGLTWQEPGDALYATMIYFGTGILVPRAPLKWRTVATIAVCFAIEFSQLYRAPWIVAVRHTTMGALVLGRGFLFEDLLAYVVGALLGLVVDWMVVVRHRGAPVT